MAPPEAPPEEAALQQEFSALIKSLPAQRARPSVSKFVKKIEGLQEVSLPPSLPRKAALALVEKGLIRKFTGLWPSPKTVQRWVERNWADKTQGKISIRFCGKGYFTFHFETKEDKDLIFRNAPYFMDSRGLYLNKWTPDFDLELDIPNAVPVWVRLPHLPLHCWGDESVRAIGNDVGITLTEVSRETTCRLVLVSALKLIWEEAFQKQLNSKSTTGRTFNSLTMSRSPSSARYVTSKDTLLIVALRTLMLKMFRKKNNGSPSKRKDLPLVKNRTWLLVPLPTPPPSLHPHLPNLHSLFLLPPISLCTLFDSWNPFFHRPPPMPSMPFPFLRNPLIPYLNLILPLLPFP